MLNRKKLKGWPALIVAAMIISPGLIKNACAETENPSQLTLDRIFTQREFAPKGFGPVTWKSDDTSFTVLEPSRSMAGAKDVVRYDSETGRREIMVPAERLIPSGERRPLQIARYSWSSDFLKLLVFTNTNRGGRKGVQGDYWVLDLSFWNLRKLGGDAEPGTMMAARFSPDGRRVGYVREHNLFVEDLFTREIIQITQDGSDSLINGASTRLYSGISTSGLRWSPDGKHIAFPQFDITGVKDFTMINNTDSLYPKIIEFQHVKPGEQLPSCRAGVVNSSGGPITWLDIPGDPRNHYIYQLDWASNPEEILIQQLNRQQNTMRVMTAEVETGKTRLILVEKDETWLEPKQLHWINQGKEFVWISERDGWRHIFRVSRSSSQIKVLTPGDFDSLDILSIDEGDGWIYFTASPDNPSQRYMYRARLDGSGKSERVTPDGRNGTHDYQVSPRSGWAIHTHSSFESPPYIDLVRLPRHDPVHVLEDNNQIRERLEKIDRSPVEFFRIDIGNGTGLDGWCIKPPDFDPEKRYPVLFHAYSMPAGQTVLDKWGGNRNMWHFMLAQKGYLVMSIDSRGTPAPRGRAWRKIIYKRHGILPSDDQAAGVRAITARWSYVDAEKVGIYGWSGGGLMSLLCIFRHPDVYQTAMAGAYISNHRYYHAAFTERFLGLPQDNPDAYRKTAAMMYAKNLKGNLLLMHGTGDDNVHYQNTEVLVNELIKANKRFSMMVYPNRSHGLSEGQNSQRHRHEIYTWYLMQNMPGDQR